MYERVGIKGLTRDSKLGDAQPRSLERSAVMCPLQRGPLGSTERASAGLWFPARRSHRLDPKVQADQREHDALEVLDKVIEGPQAVRIGAVLHIEQ